jgi:hypothetical protein
MGIYTLPASELSARKAPHSSISALFDRLNASPELATRLNATYPKRGVFKTAGLTNALADQKTTIDLSAARLSAFSALAPELIGQLRTEFTDALDFFNAVERELVPAVMKATSDAAGFDIAVLHRERNHNYRLVDYFTKQSNQDEEAARCGARKDYGTYCEFLSLYLRLNSDLHLSAKTVYLGWNTSTLLRRLGQPSPLTKKPSYGGGAVPFSGDRIRATGHRVQTTLPGTRRLSAVLFAASDINTILRPLNGNG